MSLLNGLLNDLRIHRAIFFGRAYFLLIFDDQLVHFVVFSLVNGVLSEVPLVALLPGISLLHCAVHLLKFWDQVALQVRQRRSHDLVELIQSQSTLVFLGDLWRAFRQVSESKRTKLCADISEHFFSRVGRGFRCASHSFAILIVLLLGLDQCSVQSVDLHQGRLDNHSVQQAVSRLSQVSSLVLLELRFEELHRLALSLALPCWPRSLRLCCSRLALNDAQC